MRWIDKSQGAPAILDSYIQLQIPLQVNLDYDSFPDKRQLRMELTREQCGLCAFTGAGIDDRLGTLAPDGTVTTAVGNRVKLKSHIAHLKSQRQCQQELIAAGRAPGHDLGEDMCYRNMVAALLIEGSEPELFGAAAQKDWWHPTNFVSPTEPTCEERFRYGEFGSVQGLDAGANETINRLRLYHPTLTAWRHSAISAFINPESPDDFTEPYLRALVQAMETPQDGKLPEYSFVIKQVAERLLQGMAAP